jgi:hypothetical protein
VFCGSSFGASPAYADAAKRFGALLAEHGYGMVFGGGGLGLMGETARAARDGGAKVQGILPDFLKHLEPPLATGEKVILTSDLFRRKEMMMERSDAFVCLPGGNGTMDEFFEVLTSAQLDLHAKPIVIVNVEAFFDPLLALLDHIVAKDFAKPDVLKLFHVRATPDEAITLLGDLLQRTAAD